ncbi:Carboxypeptidase S1 [Aspergillus sp. HF37]|nr:Carboxypeptidase S1 [Aspergillus sp. HF37]
MLRYGYSLMLLLGAALAAPQTERTSWANSWSKRQLPDDPTGVQKLITPNGNTIRYKEPGKHGVCETTPGVRSYSGYIDLSPDSHTFFYFFEARHDPANAPLTLWLNGGPGSDSLIGLYQELGPCSINSDYESYVNPYSWNEVSNMLFISQPVGVGFSYDNKTAGSLNPLTGAVENASVAGVEGRFPVIDPKAIDTTDEAAHAAWEIVQGFMGGLPLLDPRIQSKTFNLWTESYGGHYGPAFYHHFYEQNQKIANGEDGIHLDFDTLGIINGIIDEGIQAPSYPEFAVNNTYGIKAVNDTVYNYMKFANSMPNGCQDQVAACSRTKRESVIEHAICTEATNMCRDNVESPYYSFSGRGTYDIRASAANNPTPAFDYNGYLERPDIKNALGVDLNYTQSSSEIYYAFQQTGDFSWPNFIHDLNELLDLPVRVALIYGDADYICNWFGGEVVSNAVEYSGVEKWHEAGYVPMMVDGHQYGDTREYGNYSFTRIFQAGHMVPFYQPSASLALFNRTLFGWDIATGEMKINDHFITYGPPESTHRQDGPL